MAEAVVKETHKEEVIEACGGDYDPAITAYDHRTVVIKDGRGGMCRFDSSEINDLVVMLSSLMQNDAAKVKIVDLTHVTAE